MSASYPTSAKIFTTEADDTVIYADDVNAVQLEIKAIEDDLIAGLPVARGGTGATTAPTAINNLVPAQGSSANKVLGTNGSVVSWLASIQSLLTGTGDLLISTGANTPARLAVGTVGQKLVSTGTLPVWQDDMLDNNYIIDGNMQICQVNPVVGTEITNPTAGTYPVFDLWKTTADASGGTLPTHIHSQQLITSGSILGSKYCYRINVNGAGTSLGTSSYQQIYQMIENGTQNLCGLNKKVTLSFWAKTSISGTKRLGIHLQQNYGTGGSPTSPETIVGTTFTLTSSWQKFTATISTNTLVSKVFGTNNDDTLQLYLWTAWGSSLQAYVGASTAETFVGSGDIEIAQVKLEPGDTATTFMPRPFSEELRRCQRYYEKSYDYGIVPGTSIADGLIRINSGVNTASSLYILMWNNFKVPKRIKISGVSYWDAIGTISRISIEDSATTSTNNISPSAANYNISQNGFGMGHNTTGFSGIRFHYVADARF